MAQKKKKNIWDNNVNNIVASKSIETKTNSKYLIEYLDEVIKPSVLLLPKMYGYFNTFRDKDWNKDNKLVSFRRDGEKVLKTVKPFVLKLKTSNILN